jgi:hypothetical protein
MSQSAGPITAESHQRHGSLRRWALRIAAGLGVLLILIFIIGEIVFYTDLPRNLVVNAIEKQLGLRITVKSLSTGWLGHTTLRDVAITLPLDDKAFLSVPTLQLTHSPLPWLILSGSLSVHEISIENPELHVVQDPGGSWNLQEVAQLLARAGGSKNASSDANAQVNPGIPQLPQLDVRNATFVITDNEGRSATISNLAITGKSDGPLVWDYQAEVPDQLDIAGKVAPGGVWSHEINLKLHDIGSWMSPWVKSWPRSAHLNALWSGQVADGQVVGRLDFNDAVFGSSKISGPLEITIQQNQTTLRPAGLLIANSASAALSARVDGGQILLGAADIESKELSIALAGGRASLDGKIILSDGTANLHAAWRDLVFPESVKQSGDLTVDYTPSLGQPHFSAVLTSQGASNTLAWDGQIDLYGSGNTSQMISLSVTAPKLRFNSLNKKSSLDLSGFAAQLNRTQAGLLLTNLRLGEAHPLTGHGGYTSATRTAWLSLDARGWPIPRVGSGALNLDLNIWSNPSRVHLDQLYLHSGMLSAYGNGDYVYDLPKPVSAHLFFTESSRLDSPQDQSQPFRGNLRGNLDLYGTLKPANLTITGNASGADVHFGERPLGNLTLALEGNVRDGLVSLASHNVKFLGGDWYISGQWPVKNTLIRLDTVRVQHLSLPLALARDNVSGELDGNWSVDIHQFNPAGIFVHGSAAVSNFAIGSSSNGSCVPLFAADQIQFPDINVENGEIDIKPIKLSRKVSGVNGHAEAELFTTVADLTRLSVKLDASSWPLQSANALCLLWATGNVDVDVKNGSALGHVDLHADTSSASKPIGRVDAAFDFNRRQIDATKIQIGALGGSASGNASFDFDNPFQAIAQLDWKNVDLSRLQTFGPDFVSLTGKIKGSLQVHPATGPRPLQPLAIALHISTDKVKCGQINLGDLQIFAYVGPHRIVLDDDPSRPSQLLFADGIVQFWGRVSKHPGDLYQSLVQVNLQNLNLDAILPAGSKAASTPGLLSGRITVVGRPGAPDLAFGEGHLVLSRSDLAGTGPIAILYNLMHFSHSAAKPRGSGTIDFQVQQENVFITALRYFDRGAEVHAAGVISKLSKRTHSQLDITVVGSARPLTSIDLPGVSDIDDALNAIQRDAVTVRVTGDLDKPVTKKVLFSEIGQEMQNLLFGAGRQNNSSE